MAGLAGAVLALSLPAPATAAERAGPSASAITKFDVSSVQWKSCPSYSDEVIRSLRVTQEQLPAFRTQLKRLQTRRAIGGTVYTVADDVHVSTTRVPGCAADVVRYFETGRIGRGCEGSGTPA
ncbi:hypothetical protein ACIBI9_09390 [Nonomuraea sp. NPDC050451]|uniref:hypothetical protein n=1 Tax=Nonomuraea sp. NPDC050451 TaxID=3364364 RepID=UPI00379CECFC